jgi:tetratricopeptide (TPR) repeat protein
VIIRLLLTFIVSLVSIQGTLGQLFSNPDNVRLATRSVDYIYNMESDSAHMWMDSVERKLPNHPIVPMLRAVDLLWQSVPYVTEDTTFEKFKNHLYEVAAKARQIDGGKQENPEAIFFEMAARGLLAEYYADAGNYIKAVNEASKAYVLLKKAFSKTDEISDFLFTVGIYNYFREAYPDKYPVYKPFVWVFRNGDKSKGIAQLELAGQGALVVRVEAYIYLAYIYLRYEYKPELAQKFVAQLVKDYPKNVYIRSKYLESMAINPATFKKIMPSDFQIIATDSREYYQLSSFAFDGLYHEWVLEDYEKAIVKYKRALSIGAVVSNRGEYFKSLCYLGLGRIYQSSGNYAMAQYYLIESIAIAETADIKEEAKRRLENISD